MLDKNKFVVKEQAKMFSSKKAFDIVDADGGQPLGTAVENTGGLAAVLGMVLGKDKMPLTIEFRKKPDDAIVFSVRRKGFIFKKVQLVDGDGQVIGSYKAKMLSLTGGYHIYDQDGKHVSDIKGKMFKSEYKFMTPDGSKEMGSVSKKWGGVAKELFTSAGTYGVQIEPEFAGDKKTKMLILGAAIAIHAIFNKGGGKGGKGGGDDEGGGGGDD